MATLTELGFDRPTFDEILNAQIARAKTLFGENIDTSETSVLGKYIRINVSDIDTLYQALEGVYYARFPNTAYGASLDRLCVFAGITRNAATYARHSITINGIANAVIPVGFAVSNAEQSVMFHTIEDYTIGTNGSITAYVDCDEAGTVGNIASQDITTVVNPSADVSSIAGVTIINYGQEKETDTALRKRFNEAVAGIGNNSLASIKSAILRVQGVTGCTIVENATDSTVDGIAPHSFCCYVLCTDNALPLVAKEIFNKKPLGIQPSGQNTYTVEDEYGGQHTISFNRTTEKPIYINISLKKSVYFPENGINEIKNNLVNYLSEFSNGETVYLSSLYNYINIEGVITVTSLTLSSDGTTYAASDITCTNSQVARSAAEKISVTIVS